MYLHFSLLFHVFTGALFSDHGLWEKDWQINQKGIILASPYHSKRFWCLKWADPERHYRAKGTWGAEETGTSWASQEDTGGEVFSCDPYSSPSSLLWDTWVIPVPRSYGNQAIQDLKLTSQKSFLKFLPLHPLYLICPMLEMYCKWELQGSCGINLALLI